MSQDKRPSVLRPRSTKLINSHHL